VLHSPAPEPSTPPPHPFPAPATRPADRSRRRGRRLLRRVGITLGALLALVVLALAGGALWLRGRLDASLPVLDGELAVAGLAGPVVVARDALGVPTVRGGSRADVAFATGWLHAQDRFFRMDLQRRRAAGELAELFGAAAVPADREARIHRFRARAGVVVAALPPADRALLEAYAAGVAAGLAGLGERPFEYVALRAEPAPWRVEDSILTVYAMFLTLQGDGFAIEAGRERMAATLPAPLVAFLTSGDPAREVPLVGAAPPAVPVPGPEAVDLRGADGLARAAALPWPAVVPSGAVAPPGSAEPAEPPLPAGSNNWAVAGSRTADGGALLANDMHLELGLPNIWYRASLVWPGDDGRERRVTGVTLPGVPAVVVGSNGAVAWGFTNTQLDTSDRVVVEVDPADPGRYLAPDGPRPFLRHAETIRVAGGGAESFEVVETVWGPLVPDPPGLPAGSRRALRWVAYEPGAVNLASVGFETAGSVDEAVAIAHASGIPVQNLVAADASGRIAWTLAGRLPRRVGLDGLLPVSWAGGGRGWDGLVPPEEVPRLVDPESGILWTANNRTLGDDLLAPLGAGHQFYDAARAARIHERLAALERATPADLLSIQLDDRSRFYERWRDAFVAVLTAEAVAADPRRGEVRAQLAAWEGHAAVDSVGYRIVRGAREFLARDVFAALTAPCRDADPEFDLGSVAYGAEAPLWALVAARPEHLLPPGRASWDAALLAAIDEALASLTADGRPLAEQTWGARNVVRLRHPFSRAFPAAARFLDLPPRPLPGDRHVPRVQTPGYGASERLVVSPGREQAGFFHMPGGQSGHPRSPHYGDGHAAWEEGRPTPFLPGPAAHELRLVPAG
jgi:penicillin amidase